MPGFDGTGPMGKGPKTGGGRGFCSPGKGRFSYGGYFCGGYPYGGYPYDFSARSGVGRGGFPRGGGRGRAFGGGRGKCWW